MLFSSWSICEEPVRQWLWMGFVKGYTHVREVIVTSRKIFTECQMLLWLHGFSSSLLLSCLRYPVFCCDLQPVSTQPKLHSTHNKSWQLSFISPHTSLLSHFSQALPHIIPQDWSVFNCYFSQYLLPVKSVSRGQGISQRVKDLIR